MRLDLPLFLLVSLFGMRPTAQRISINNQPTTDLSLLVAIVQTKESRSFPDPSPPDHAEASPAFTSPERDFSGCRTRILKGVLSPSPWPQFEDRVSQPFGRLRRREAFLSAHGAQMRSGLEAL